MSRDSVEKNSAVEEIGCLSKGFFGKVYRDSVTIFAPDGDVYIKLWKKSTPFAEARAKTIIDTLNAQNPEIDSSYQAVLRERESMRNEIEELRKINFEYELENQKLHKYLKKAQEASDYNRQIIHSLAHAVSNLSDKS